MAPLSARPELSNLTLRVMSAAVLLPAAAVLVWFGTWYFAAFVVLIGAAMGWEYSTLCGAKAGFRALVTVLLGTIPIVLFIWSPLMAVGWGVAGACLIALAIIRDRFSERRLFIGGIIYLSAGTLSIAWLRLIPEDGALIVFWIVVVVVGTDVGAYFAGRGIGGPKLAPRISPSKTWAGLVGGMICAAIGGWVVGQIGTGEGSLSIAVVSAGLAIFAQIGDLMESGVKRHFGAKDSGTLIPGHGGILDRLDGYLAVAPVVALVTYAAGGNLLEWY